MRILVTGAGGFVGQELVAALLADDRTAHLTLTDVQEPAIPKAVQRTEPASEVRCVAADLTKARHLESLLSNGFDIIYILHGIMSGGAEANLDLGLQVNLDSTRALLDSLRSTGNPHIKVIYPSSLAVYGPQAAGTVTSSSAKPSSTTSPDADSLTARVCRLSTIIVRPGKPSAAASSFASSILREPLHGLEAKLPVPKDLRMWICSPKTVVTNLMFAAEIPREMFGGYKSRTVNLPGKTVTVQQMLDALEKVGGKDALSLVKEEHDQAAYDIVASWPDTFDTERAREVGFIEDQDLEQTLRDFLHAHVKKIS